MPKKPSLAETLGQRRQQSQQVEPVKPENPIAALQAVSTEAVEDHKQEAQVEKRTRARTHTRAIPTLEEVSGDINIETLYRKLQARKHLSSYTFRFRAEELDEIDQIANEMEQEAPGKFSKNDLARLALLWFCEDYRTNGEESILAQIVSKA
jgi:hypothetical protein